MRNIVALVWVVVALYSAGILTFFMAAIRKQLVGEEASADCIPCRPKREWFVMSASLLTSNIGSEEAAGLAGAGASSGALGQIELQASFSTLATSRWTSI